MATLNLPDPATSPGPSGLAFAQAVDAALDALAAGAPLVLTGVAGTDSAYTATAPAVPASSQLFLFTPHLTSGAAPTLSINGTNAQALQAQEGDALQPGDLLAGTPYLFTRVGSTYRLLFQILGDIDLGFTSEVRSTGEASLFLPDNTNGTVDGGVVVDLTGNRTLQTENYSVGTPLSAPARFRRVGDFDAVDPAWWFGGRSVAAAAKWAQANRRKLLIKDSFDVDTDVVLGDNSFLEFIGDGQLLPSPSFSGNSILRNDDLVGGNTGIRLIKPVIPLDNVARSMAASIYLSACTDIIISDPNLSGAEAINLYLLNCARARIIGGQVTDSTLYGILADACSQVHLLGSTVSGNAIDGFRTRVISDLLVDRCTFFSNGDPFYTSMTLTGASGTFSVGETITSSGGASATVVAYNSGVLQIDPDSITGTFTLTHTILGATSGASGTIDDYNENQGQGAGLRVAKGDTPTGAVRISNSLFHDNGKSGATCFGAAEVWYQGNQAYHNGDTGLDAIGDADSPALLIVYENNHSWENRDHGIHAGTEHTEDLTTEAFTRATIMRGNNCHDNGHNPVTNLDSHVPTLSGNIAVTNTTGVNTTTSVVITDNICVSDSFTAPYSILVHADIVTGGDAGTLHSVINRNNILFGWGTMPVAYLGGVLNIDEGGNRSWGGTQRPALGTSATPSVAGFGAYTVATSGTAITNFADGFDGKEIDLYFTGARTVTHDGTNIALVGGVNFVGANGSTLRLRRVGATKWTEVGRSVL